MKTHAPLLALALLLPLSAEAANPPKIRNIRIRQTTDTNAYRAELQVLSDDPAAEVMAMRAELDRARVLLEPSDAYLHASAAPRVAPVEGAGLSLTLYDLNNEAIADFGGVVVDGALRLSRIDDRGDPGDCGARAGCPGGGGAPLNLADLELRGARLLSDGTVTIELSGADALSVASATFAVTTTLDTEVCAAWDRAGACVAWEQIDQVDEVEVDLDEVGTVWAGGAPEVEGAQRVVVRAEDARGRRIDEARVELSAPWADAGGGQSAVPVDEDPLTTVGLASHCRRWSAVDATCQESADGLLVVSDGWSALDALPELAELTLEGGETWSAPALGYQRTGARTVDDRSLDFDAVTLTVGGNVEARAVAVAGGAAHVFEAQRIVVIVKHDDNDRVTVSVSAWGPDAAALPDTLELGLVGADETTPLSLELDDEIAAVFGVDVDLAGDAEGLDLMGRLRLLGPADRRGRRSSLARGRFAGQLGADAEGDLDLAAIDPDGGVASRGDILIGGEPIGIERAVGDTVVPVAPPVVVYKNGVGTRNLATTNTTKPGLL